MDQSGLMNDFTIIVEKKCTYWFNNQRILEIPIDDFYINCRQRECSYWFNNQKNFGEYLH